MTDYIITLFQNGLIKEASYNSIDKNNRTLVLTGSNGVKYRAKGNAAKKIYNALIQE